MKSPWTPALDKELMALSAQGLSFREIAQRMGMTRNAVLGRSTRLRGIVYPSTILAWKANNERRRKGPRKPEAGRRAAIADAWGLGFFLTYLCNTSIASAQRFCAR